MRRISLCVLAALLTVVIPTASSVRADDTIHWKTLGIGDGLADDTIHDIVVSPEAVYFATPKGLSVWNRNTRTAAVIPGPDDTCPTEVLALLFQQDTLWVGTNQGLARLHDGRLKAVPVPELNGLRIKALAVKDSELYFGTDHGVWRMKPGAPHAESLPNIPQEAVNSLRIDDQNILISLHEGQIHFYDIRTGKPEEVRLELNPLKNNVNAIGVSSDYCWFATDGSGVIQYDKVNRMWTTLTTTTHVDKFLTALVEDGRYIWFATFYGLYRYDQTDASWKSYHDDLFTQYELSALAMDDRMIWVGTRGKGVIYGEKHTPYVRIRLGRRYFGNEHAEVTGQLRGQGEVIPSIGYASLTFPDIWISQHTRIERTGDNGFRAQIDFNKLPDNIYHFRVQVRDAVGENEERFTLIKETTPLVVTFFEHEWQEGSNRVTGRYQNPAIDRIVVAPGPVDAVLNRAYRTFAADVTLGCQDHELTATAYDFTGRSAVFSQAIHVLPATRVEIASTTPAFTPGDDQVRFAITQKFLAPLDEWQFIIVTEDDVPLRTFQGSGPLPDEVVWDGKTEDGEFVDGGMKLHYYLQAKEKKGETVTTERRAIIAKLAPRKQDKGLVINIGSTFLFDLGQADLKPGHMVLFDEIARIIGDYPQCRLLIEGHSDNLPIQTAKFASNQELSEARAASVANYLITHYSIDKGRITTHGYGDSRPVADNRTEAGRKKNRRVEVVILEH